MPIPIHEVVEQLRRASLGEDDQGLADSELLHRFLERGDQAAVAVLLGRHGAMVWGVCRRILGDHHESEDAFQATFLVLVRKAASIRNRDAVGNWLYGVAHQTALKARTMLAKRRKKKRQAALAPARVDAEYNRWGESQALLDQELSRLPDIYRTAIVLCDLEGKKQKDAARELRCPEGTVAARLSRGRRMLAQRLAKQGVTLSGFTLPALISQTDVKASLISSTVKAVSAVALDQAVTADVVSTKVAALAEGVLKAMLIKKLQKATLLILVLAAGLTAGAFVYHSRAAAPANDGPAPQSRNDDKKAEPDKAEPDVPTKTGAQVTSAFAHNLARVDEEYLGKKLRVAGKVLRVDHVGVTSFGLPFLKQTDDQYYFLTLAQEPKDDKKPEGSPRQESEMPIGFIFPVSARKELAGLDKDQQVTIEGLCEGKKVPAGQYLDRYVLFTGCKVVKSK